MRRSARLALRPRRAGVRHGAQQALVDDELAGARTGAAARASAQAFGAQGGSGRRHPSGP